ncbi:hypothetical protein SLEP1_g26070 [Rubroshorea leprosula]|uniref:Uncharacterized protein n=1 Tax=Rubroshorea leprosula TaxID=152421 RepID=A0AAV5JVH5_9ROSI|nr:hypothetical protein SLEP1_g26070 [Rubroshorea leprosula]
MVVRLPCVFLLFFFFSLQLPKSPLQAAGTSFEKLVRKLGISPSSCPRT